MPDSRPQNDGPVRALRRAGRSARLAFWRGRSRRRILQYTGLPGLTGLAGGVLLADSGTRDQGAAMLAGHATNTPRFAVVINRPARPLGLWERS